MEAAIFFETHDTISDTRASDWELEGVPLHVPAKSTKPSHPGLLKSGTAKRRSRRLRKAAAYSRS